MSRQSKHHRAVLRHVLGDEQGEVTYHLLQACWLLDTQGFGWWNVLTDRRLYAQDWIEEVLPVRAREPHRPALTSAGREVARKFAEADRVLGGDGR